MRLEKRIERQRQLVETLAQRLAFERLVLERLEARHQRPDQGRSEPETEARTEPFPEPQREPLPISSLADVYRAARLRAAR
jgi:hypothetical protein